MSLYLSPPTGTISFHKLEEYATKRLQFLLRLVACNNKQEVESVLEDADVVDQSDCMITNTAKDEISHHILRLTLGGDQESMSFFCDSELALFKLRVENMVVDEWTVFFKSVEKFLRKLEGCGFDVRLRVLSDLRLVFEILKAKFESWYRLSTDICGQTAGMSVSIPFQLVLRLVAGRLVNVVKGMAAVPIVHLKDVFIELFEKLMVAATHQASIEREWAMRDERIRRLVATLKGLFKAETKIPGYQPGQIPTLRLADLWEHSAMFPPCMKNVVKVLQDEHTLKHHDRVQLTLFLKELGLPVNDSLLLWKREYSVPTKANTSRDRHPRWQGNERRYIYNIRHLYGLEGSRRSYRAHSCSAIQNRSLICGDAGGCPFVSHDIAALKLSLLDQDIHEDNIDHILKLCDHKMYGHACQSFMLNKLKQAGKIHNDFISHERHIKIEVANSQNKDVMIGDNNINTCQERDQHNGVTREKLKCFARSNAHSCEKMLPYERANNFAVKSDRTCGTGLSLNENLAENILNLQNEMMLLRPSLRPCHNQSIHSLCVSRDNMTKGVSLNGDFSRVNNKRGKVIYGRKRYLFKMTSKNLPDRMSQKRTCSNTGSYDGSMTSTDSCLESNNKQTFGSSKQQADDTPNKPVSQPPEIDCDTAVVQDKLFLASDTRESPLQVHCNRISYCSKQAENTSLGKRKHVRFSCNVCRDCSMKASNGISESALVGATSGLADPDKRLADPGKPLSDPSEGNKLSDPVDDKWLSHHVERKQLSDLTESKCLSDFNECKLISYPVEGKWLSDPAECALSSDSAECKLLDSAECKLLSDPAGHKLLSDSADCKLLSYSVEGKWLSDPGECKLLSDPGECKLLSYPVEGKWLSDPGECKLLSDPVNGKWLSDPVDGTWLSDPGECKLSDPGECKLLPDPAESKWLPHPGEVKPFLDPDKLKQLLCVNTQQPEYQTTCPAEYSSRSTVGNAQLSDPLSEGGSTSPSVMKTGTKFFCGRSQSGELSHVTNEIIERQTESLRLHSLAEHAVSIKKPRDVYWFARRL